MNQMWLKKASQHIRWMSYNKRTESASGSSPVSLENRKATELLG